MVIRVLLADDYEPFRREVRQILEDHRDIEVVAEASSGSEAIERATQVRPDVAVLDVRMQPVSGISAIPRILERSPRTAVLMLSIHNDKHYVSRSIEFGARGYLLKDSVENILVEAIRCVHRGQTFFDPEIVDYVPEP